MNGFKSTTFAPSSAEKLAVMKARSEQGWPIFHPEDSTVIVRIADGHTHPMVTKRGPAVEKLARLWKETRRTCKSEA